MIHLRTLGALDLRRADGTEVRPVLAQPKRLALLTYLAVATPTGFHRRDTLLALFWPDLDTAHARNALSRALYVLRRELGEGAILSRGDEEVGLSPDCVSCDAAVFEAALTSGRLADALQVYQGELLPGFHVSQVPGFERWLEDRRASLRQRGVEAGWTLAEEAERRGNTLLAQHWARRAAELSPYDETGLRRLMQLLVRSGERGAAALAYQQFARRLWEDLQVEPSDDTKAHVESLRTVATGARPAAPAPPAPVESTIHVESPALGTDATRGSTAFRPRKPLRVTLALLIVGGCVWILQSSPSGVRGNPPYGGDGQGVSVAVLPFTVRTENAGFEYLREGMVDLLSAKLNSAVGVRSIDPARILTEPSLQSKRPVSPKTGKKIAARMGAAYCLLGSIVAAGNHLRITGSIYARDRARPIAVSSTEGREDDLFELVDRLTADLMGTIGQPAERFTRVASITTHSPAALRAFLQGEHAFRVEDFANHARSPETIASQRHAIDLDSTFALAYYRLAVAAGWNDSLELASWAASRAFRHADRLPDYYRLLVEALHADMTGDAKRAIADYRTAISTHPDDPEAWARLAMTMLFYGPLLGEPWTELREPAAMSTQLNPSDHVNWLLLAYLAAHAQDFRGVDTLIRRAYPRVPDYWELLAALGGGLANRSERALARLDRADPLDRAIAALLVLRYLSQTELSRRLLRVATTAADSDWSAESRYWLAITELTAGRPRAAQQELTRLALLDSTRAVEAQALLVAWDMVRPPRGELEAARTALTRIGSRPAGRHSPLFGSHSPVEAAAIRLYLLGVLSLRLGERERAVGAVHELSRFPESVPENSVPHDLAVTLEAELHATLDDDPGAAIELLSAMDFRIPPDILRGSPILFPIFARQRFLQGEWLRAMGRIPEALRYYESIASVDYVEDLPYLAPAKLSTARIYQESGEFDKAREAYSEVVTRWQDAEPELQPLVAEARSRLQSLESTAATAAQPR